MIVSCIIPTFRQMDFLFDALDSIFIQDYGFIEIIVADDASDNFDRELVSEYLVAQKRKNILSYDIVTHDYNVGTVKNMNDAIKRCTGEIIMPLASDDMFFDAHVISKVVKKFVECNCGILSCSRYKYSADMKESIRLMPHPGYRHYLEETLSTAEKQYRAMALGRAFELASGAALYYKSAFMKDHGAYDETYILWEDGPFLAQVARSGKKIETAYDIVAIKYRAGGISSKKQKAPSKIQTDYCNAIQREYIKFGEDFSNLDKRIMKGRLELQKNYGQITTKISFKYPEAVINEFYINIKKVLYLLSYRIRSGEKNNEK